MAIHFCRWQRKPAGLNCVWDMCSPSFKAAGVIHCAVITYYFSLNYSAQERIFFNAWRKSLHATEISPGNDCLLMLRDAPPFSNQHKWCGILQKGDNGTQISNVQSWFRKMRANWSRKECKVHLSNTTHTGCLHQYWRHIVSAGDRTGC